MSRQYLRAYELTIIPEGGESRIITGLRISFEVTKSTIGVPNLAMIQVYNPNSDTLAALQSKFTKIVLNVGYEGNLRLLFKGDVRNVYQPHGGIDRVAVVYAGDGQRAWQNSRFNKTLAETVSIKAAVDEVIKTFNGISKGAIEGLPDIADKLLGDTISGSSKDVMDMLGKQYGFTWSIQDEEVVITSNESPLEGTEAVVISSATGMVGSPTITYIGANVTTLLNTRLVPNYAFKIESPFSDIQMGNLYFTNVKKTNAEGTYKILETVFKGDSREGDWISTVKGISINA